MTSVLFIQERGRHEENREFREALNFKRSIMRLGYNAEVWGLNYENYSTPFTEIAKDYDVVFLLENYDQTNWLPVDDIKNCGKLKVFWSIDAHCAFYQHRSTIMLVEPDILLSSTARYLNMFPPVDRKIWFPNCYPDDLIDHRPEINKEHLIGFCGNLNNRQALLQYMHMNGINVKQDIFVIGQSMVNAINSYHVQFNMNISDDINYRTFETLGCKTALLTNYHPDLEKLFPPGSAFIYSNQEQLIKCSKFLMENLDIAKDSAEHGYRVVKERHTYDVRAKQFIDIINNREYPY